ncbi:Alternative cytochrome c oxidase subunit 2 [Aureliella helgolandensis]|uniref:cytochrome-c oxidase n=1 Tax=Aureliella helgolandensis TaxID=2527968 RepID=A0A518GH81_9BACT|nr:Alternative cytochrome c oxidase subunit 2 [Aureliella helgolandensis]
MAVPVWGTLCCLASWLAGNGVVVRWLPENINSLADEAEALQVVAFALVGLAFVAVGVALFGLMWKFDAAHNPQPARYIHGHRGLQTVWTVVPTVALIGLLAVSLQARWDLNAAWLSTAGGGPAGAAEGQPQSPQYESPQYEVLGRPFEWRVRYAGQDQRLGTTDDVLGEVNELHVPVDETSLVALKAEEAVQYLSVPALRLTCKLVPGRVQLARFSASKMGAYEVVCCEQRPQAYYRVVGRLMVETAEDHRAYLQRLQLQQYQREFSTAAEAQRFAVGVSFLQVNDVPEANGGVSNARPAVAPTLLSFPTRGAL